jgi:hypothetical protein
VSEIRKPPRPWRVIAAEVAVEPDPNKLLELVRELNLALNEELSRGEGQNPAIKSA